MPDDACASLPRARTVCVMTIAGVSEDSCCYLGQPRRFFSVQDVLKESAAMSAYTIYSIQVARGFIQHALEFGSIEAIGDVFRCQHRVSSSSRGSPRCESTCVLLLTSEVDVVLFPSFVVSFPSRRSYVQREHIPRISIACRSLWIIGPFVFVD